MKAIQEAVKDFKEFKEALVDKGQISKVSRSLSDQSENLEKMESTWTKLWNETTNEL